MQGRLSPPQNDKIQEFPDNWLSEFGKITLLDLNHIEYIITRKSIEKNKLNANGQLKGLKINSICLDTIVDSFNLLWENLIIGCTIAQNNNIPFITIPLLEGSNVENDEIRKNTIDTLLQASKLHPDILFSIEAELSIIKLKEIIDSSNNFFVTYDTGNITSHGVSHAEFIKTFAGKINNVHLKDRTFNKETVEPGTGDTNFPQIFSILKSHNYNGLFTIQTARGENGKEMETIKRHIKYFKSLW